MSKNPLLTGQTAPAQQKPQGQPDINVMFQQFRQNPMKYLTGYNIPQNINSPEQIVRFLADNGKVPPMLQARVNAMLGRR
jgi:hypothetical protein